MDQPLVDLVGDVPYFTVGVLAIAAVTLLLIKSKLTQLSSMINLSAFFTFSGAIIDFARLMAADKTSSHLAAVVSREMTFAASMVLRYLFFWSIVAAPSRGEIIQIPPESQSYLSPDDGPMHSGSWTRWGVIGIFLKYMMLTSVIVVGVLETLWRIGYSFSLGPQFVTLFSASATVQVATSIIFTLKLLGNLLFTLAPRRMPVLIDYIPILVGLVISIGTGIADIASYRFSETALGRLLQSLELYILILYMLVVAFDQDPTTQPVAEDAFIAVTAPSKASNPRDSFAAVRIVTPPALRPPVPKRPRLSVLLDARTSSERLASWVSRRISGRPDPESTRLWNARRGGDLESGTGVGPIALKSPDDEKSIPEPTSASIYSYYGRESVTRPDSEVIKSPRKPRSSNVANPAPPPLPPMPRVTISAEPQSGMDSPIFGLNGVRTSTPTLLAATQNTSDHTIPTIATQGSIASSQSSGGSILRRAQEDLDRSVAGLKLFDPSIKSKSVRGSSYYSDASLHSPSAGSLFSLKRFPAPPRRPDLGLEPHRTSTSQASLGPSEAGDNDEDMNEFDLVPPQLPAAVQSGTVAGGERSTSFPSTMRGSEAISGLFVPSAAESGRVRYPGREITSFIDGVMDQSGPTGRHFANDSIEEGLEDLDVLGRPSQLFRQSRAPAATSPLRSRMGGPFNLRESALRKEHELVVTLPTNPRPARTYNAENIATSSPSRMTLLATRANGPIDPDDISRPIPIEREVTPLFQSPRRAPRAM